MNILLQFYQLISFMCFFRNKDSYCAMKKYLKNIKNNFLTLSFLSGTLLGLLKLKNFFATVSAAFKHQFYSSVCNIDFFLTSYNTYVLFGIKTAIVQYKKISYPIIFVRNFSGFAQIEKFFCNFFCNFFTSILQCSVISA